MNLHKTRMSLFYSFSIETTYMSCHRYCKTAESALSPRISCCGSCIYPRSLRSLRPRDSGHSKPCLCPQCLTAFYPHTLYILSLGRQAGFIPPRLWFFSHLPVVVFVYIYIYQCNKQPPCSQRLWHKSTIYSAHRTWNISSSSVNDLLLDITAVWNYTTTIR